MIIYFSGGSPICETTLVDPPIMPSYFVNVDTNLGEDKKHNKPDSRLRTLFEARRATKKRLAKLKKKRKK